MNEAIQFMLKKGNSILLEKRADDDDEDPGLVSIPGGHVEPGETPEQALARELNEEVDVDLEESKLICTLPYTSSKGKEYKLYYYLVTKWKGEIKKKDVGNLIFSDLKNIQNILSVEVDKIAVQKLMEKK
jgi:mutator protein MutT